MCEIGQPIQIIDVEPLSLPAPLRREKEPSTDQPVSDTTIEPAVVTVEKL